MPCASPTDRGAAQAGRPTISVHHPKSGVPLGWLPSPKLMCWPRTRPVTGSGTPGRTSTLPWVLPDLPWVRCRLPQVKSGDTIPVMGHWDRVIAYPAKTGIVSPDLIPQPPGILPGPPPNRPRPSEPAPRRCQQADVGQRRHLAGAVTVAGAAASGRSASASEECPGSADRCPVYGCHLGLCKVPIRISIARGGATAASFWCESVYPPQHAQCTAPVTFSSPPGFITTRCPCVKANLPPVRVILVIGANEEQVLCPARVRMRRDLTQFDLGGRASTSAIGPLPPGTGVGIARPPRYRQSQNGTARTARASSPRGPQFWEPCRRRCLRPRASGSPLARRPP